MPDGSTALLLAHAGVTLTLVGLIWTIQLVHYPLFHGVGAEGFAAYAAEHGARISGLVVPLMISELALAVALVWARPTFVSAPVAWTGLALVAVIWAVTFGLSVPCHERLAAGYDAATVDRLVRTNWLRTVAWSARGALAIQALAASMR